MKGIFRSKKALFAGAVLLLILGPIVSLNLVKNHIKAKIIASMNAYHPLLRIEAEAVEVSVLRRSVSYNKLRLSLPDIDSTLEIESLYNSGLDIYTFWGNPGIESYWEIVQGRNLRFESDGDYIKIAELELENVYFDYATLLTILQKLTSKELTGNDAEQSLIGIYKKLRCSAYNFNSLRLNVKSVSAYLGKLKGYDFIGFPTGSLEIEKFEISSNGKQFFALEKAGYSNLSIPELLTDYLEDPASTLEQNPELVGRMLQNPFAAFSGLSLEGFYLRNLDFLKGFCTIGKANIELGSENNLFLRGKFSELYFMSFNSSGADSNKRAEQSPKQLQDTEFFLDLKMEYDRYEPHINIAAEVNTEHKKTGYLTLAAECRGASDLVYLSGIMDKVYLQKLHFQADNQGIIGILSRELLDTVLFSSLKEAFSKELDIIAAGVIKLKDSETDAGYLAKSFLALRQGGILDFIFYFNTPVRLSELPELLHDADEHAPDQTLEFITTPIIKN